jgi:glycerol-3-phosphate dehydrogenase
MKRNIQALADREFDLVVVGGGVYGAAIAWDASLRGLAVALVERDDFGSGTSFNNLKTVHGGIRYLQHADFKRIRESVRERRNLMRVAPHLVHPLPFLVPTYEGPLGRSRAALRTAVLLSDLLSWDRNRGVDRERWLEAGRSLSPGECLGLAPGIVRQGLTGGVLWYDAQMYNSDRLTLSFVLSASERGAVVANHVEATALVRLGDRVVGVVARDRLGGVDGLEIRARLVVNASGPWVDRLLAKLGGGERPRLFHLSKAMNLVTRALVPDRIALGLNHGGRLLCIVPWRGASIVGTSHGAYGGEPDAFEATEEDVEALLDAVNGAYPEAKLVREDVRLVHRGLLPRVPPQTESGNGSGQVVHLLKTYRIEDHRSEGLSGLLSVVGVKYTTARDVAEKTVDRSLALLGRPHVASRSATTPLAGGDFESLRDLVAGAASEHLAFSYGSRSGRVLALGASERVSEASPVLTNEIRHAVREEMAVDLASVVLRRTELGSAGHPGPAALARAASLVAEELGWSERKKLAEIEDVESFYRARS